MGKKEGHARHRKQELNSRRQFMRKIGFAAAGLGLASATGIPAYLIWQEMQTKEPTTPEGRLLAAIDNLPNTPLKTILQDEISPIFSPNRPAQLQLGSVAIPLKDARVVETYHQTGTTVDGNMNLHPKSKELLVPKFIADTDADIKVPYSFFVTPDEHRYFEEFVEGTPVITIDVQKGGYVYSGCTPEIAISSPSPTIIVPGNEGTYDALIKIIQVKEAASLFYNLRWIKETATLMEQYGLQTHIPTIDEQGNPHETEAMTSADLVFNNNLGRYDAYIDISGLMFALKAFEGTDELELAKRDSDNYIWYIDQLPAIQLGSTSQEVFTNTFNFIRDNAHGEQNLYYSSRFDWNQIP